MSELIDLTTHVPTQHCGNRLDQVAATLFPEYSRSRLQEWIKRGDLQVDGRQARPKDKVIGGESLHLRVVVEPESEALAEDIPITVVYEDASILVVDKPAGLVVHPAAGHSRGTLLNALLHHVPGQAALPRAGIVHRLDKDTSGLLVVAKSLAAHFSLVKQLQNKSVYREYLAVVSGVMTGGGTVNQPIGRDPYNRTRMAVSSAGKPAVTHYTVAQRFTSHTQLRVRLETGRTHQIRVHLSYLKHPIAGDSTYSARPVFPKEASDELLRVLQVFNRQALHARKLGVKHPVTGKPCEWESPIPEDIEKLLALLVANEGCSQD